MNAIEMQVAIIQAQIKGFYADLKSLAAAPCPDCGKTRTLKDGTKWLDGPGWVTVETDKGTVTNRCESCHGTGKLAGLSEQEILDLNHLVGYFH